MGARRRICRVAAVALVGLLAPVAGAGAASTDSEAPATAPPHWLPPEAWVYNHWMPYDEGRLYRLLRITRARPLAAAARRPPQRRAARAAPRLARCRPARRRARRARGAARCPRAALAILRSRARRTLTQGHMAQHLFFHSLHQFAIASEAPDIFGVTDARFRALRRERELSPLTIARLHGRSPARVEALSIGVLRGQVAHRRPRPGDDAAPGAAPPAPPDHPAPALARAGALQRPADHARGQARRRSRATTRATRRCRPTARHVVFEAYRQKLPQALKLGEIAVHVARPAPPRRRSALVSNAHRGRPSRRAPGSAYNATTSGDGRLVAYESAAGNANFAKRYGRIGVLLCDLRTGPHGARRPTRRSAPSGSQSAYNPVLSADGRALAFQAVRGSGRAEVFVRDLRRGTTALASRGLPRRPRGAATSIYEPALSGDGRLAAFTVADRAGARRARRDVIARVRARPGGARHAARDQPGRRRLRLQPRAVARRALRSPSRPPRAARGSPRLFVRDLRTGRTRAVTARPRRARSSIRSCRPTGASSPTRRSAAASAASSSAGWAAAARRRSPAARAAPAARSPTARPATPRWPPTGGAVAFASDATNLTPRQARPHARRLRARPRRADDDARQRAGRDERTARRRGRRRRSRCSPPRRSRPPTDGDDRATTSSSRAGTARPRLVVRVGHGRHVALGERAVAQRHRALGARSASPRRRSPRAPSAGACVRPGTYRLGCTLHAPGMRMTIVVRRPR